MHFFRDRVNLIVVCLFPSSMKSTTYRTNIRNDYNTIYSYRENKTSHIVNIIQVAKCTISFTLNNKCKLLYHTFSGSVNDCYIFNDQ